MAADVTEMGDRPGFSLVTAATRLWEHLAAQAWHGYERNGRGLLLLEAEQLLGKPDPPPTPTFIPAAMVPRGDDFRPLLLQYDPTREIMLLVRAEDGEETLLTLRASGDRRPPPACV